MRGLRGKGENQMKQLCPNCGKYATFLARESSWTEPHGEPCHQDWLQCSECGTPTDDKEIAEMNREPIPEHIIEAAKQQHNAKALHWIADAFGSPAKEPPCPF